MQAEIRHRCELWLDSNRFLMLVDGEDNGHHQTVAQIEEQMVYRGYRFSETAFVIPNLEERDLYWSRANPEADVSDMIGRNRAREAQEQPHD